MCNLIGVTNSKVYIYGFAGIFMMINEERRELTFNELALQSAVFEKFAGRVRQRALRNFADGLGINPAGAYCSYIYTCAELDLHAAQTRRNFAEALKAAAGKLLSQSAISSDALRAALEQQNLEYLREHGIIGGSQNE